MPTVVCFLCAVATSTHIAEILTGELFGCFCPIYCKSSHENWHTCVMHYFFVFYDSDCDVQNMLLLLLLLLNPSLCTPSPPLKTVILIVRTVTVKEGIVALVVTTVALFYASVDRI